MSKILSEVEKVIDDLSSILEVDYEDLISFIKVFSKAQSFSNVKFSMGPMEVEFYVASWNKVFMRVIKSEEGVKVIKEYDLTYLMKQDFSRLPDEDKFS